MKKILFLFSALMGFMLIQGCIAGGHHATIVVADFDERCWFEDHWVYRIYEGDHWVYRRWYNERWEYERRDVIIWETQKWEKKSRGDRDDGRRYENENSSEEKQGEKKGHKPEERKKNKNKN